MNTGDSPLLRARNPFDRRVLQAIAAAKPRMGVGVLERPLPGGVSLTVSRGRARNSRPVHPFFLRNSGLMHLGTVNGDQIPEISGEPIGEDGNALSMTGDFYVYVGAEITLTFNSISFFLDTWEIAELQIITSSIPLTGSLDGTTLTAYYLAAHVIDGRVQRDQPLATNLSLNVCDNGDGTSEGQSAQANWTT